MELALFRSPTLVEAVQTLYPKQGSLGAARHGGARGVGRRGGAGAVPQPHAGGGGVPAARPARAAARRCGVQDGRQLRRAARRDLAGAPNPPKFKST